ncbi:MAG: NAD(P)-dependent glycerol-3-phosphate dehydrogenase [Clostridia bacterium]|nr:NAD(P)-dependent glycerol-3-phosphate dehydrogenase [Clostridia bacterium]
MKTIAVIGSGSWGVALSLHLANMGHTVKIWSFAEEEANLINQERKCKFLPEITLPENITCYTNFEQVIQDSDIILHVTPSKFVRNILKQYKHLVNNQPIVMCAKGFEKETLYSLDQIIEEELPNKPYAVLSGPSHAEEVSKQIPTAMVVAAKEESLQEEIRSIFMNEKMRIYTSFDIKGVELGGALKNIIAFCAGIAAELGLGDNSFAALITRGLTEISRLGVTLGGKSETFYGLTGLGDLIVTCLSEHSRNRRAGKLIGVGKTIEETRQIVGMTIESIDNIEVAYELSKIHEVDMPIVHAVYDVLYNGLDPKEAVNMLMTRDKKCE